MIGAGQVSMASPLDRLVMPGKLINAHEKYEKFCDKCHEPFKKAKQNHLCLDCHKAVRQDINVKQGFHGLNQEVRIKECKYCHSDHLGRRADIVNFDPFTFDHNITDFKLTDSHTEVACDVCHIMGKKYREAKKLCSDCHKTSDIHQNRLGEKCGNCHNPKAWINAKFDHKKTKFQLKGKHNSIACQDCHPNQRYKATPKSCIGCHQLQNIHGDSYGSQCENCHNEKKWKAILFDHDKKTKFKLQFAHLKLTCSSCHKTKIYKKSKKVRGCFACHESDDKHNELYGKKCKACHTQKNWAKNTFSHDKDTKFKLKGVHKKVECHACHQSSLKKERSKNTCSSCHAVDDIHKGSQGESCAYCHTQLSWSKEIIFEHDITKFPLIGLHSLVGCESCHVDESYKIKKFSCAECHNHQDVHKAKLSSQCVLCHNPNGWRQWIFSHTDQTDYPLEKGHQGLDCLSCHRQDITQGQEIVVSDKCFTCHGDDDVHSGQFGKRCDKCHQVTKFNDLSVMTSAGF